MLQHTPAKAKSRKCLRYFIAYAVLLIVALAIERWWLDPHVTATAAESQPLAEPDPSQATQDRPPIELKSLFDDAIGQTQGHMLADKQRKQAYEQIVAENAALTASAN